MPVTPKTPEELVIMRQAGRINALALQAMRQAVRPGISTLELDAIAAEVLRQHGARPAFLGYPPGGEHPFPATITASINDELVHGIPHADRILHEGDIISLDCGTIFNGFVGDSAITVGVGTISPEAQRLLEVTEQALYEGMAAALAGNTTRDIARAVQRFVERHGYSVVREYAGHGVGRTMHEDLHVPNWWPNGRRSRYFRSEMLRPGHTFAIEPMISAGRAPVRTLDDHWTAVTQDGSLCAHFEHTVAVAPKGPPLILTAL
ncbi:MAG: type I methionyl aminopeptidase [Anaerolineae bacterium]|nr:type I methionyl aminopeptidase [Anaerolineae bacterium]